MRPMRTLIMVVLPLLGVAACSDHPTHALSLADHDGDLLSFYTLACVEQEVPDVPEVDVELPEDSWPWSQSDSLLIEAVRAADGVATIALKEPERARLADTRTKRVVDSQDVWFGTRAAVSGATICAGLEVLNGLGAELTHYHEHIGVATVRIDPEVVPQLLKTPLVDYVVPEQTYNLQG